jgi:hypothetical protein
MKTERTDPYLRLIDAMSDEEQKRIASEAIDEAREDEELMSAASEILSQIGSVKNEMTEVKVAIAHMRASGEFQTTGHTSILTDHESRLRGIEAEVSSIRQMVTSMAERKAGESSMMTGWRRWIGLGVSIGSLLVATFAVWYAVGH